MKQTIMSAELHYNNSLNETVLDRQEAIDPRQLHCITYSRPHDTCEGREVHLGNQAGGFPFTCLGHEWKGVEFLYLLGEFSYNTAEYYNIQRDILKATSGYAAKRYKKSKHKRKVRKDFEEFRHQWMLWCIWQKCLGSEAFRQHLLSFSDDTVIVEVVKRDKIWAAYPDEEGILRGGNAVGKILTICRTCLRRGTQPHIDFNLLNSHDIYILGEKVDFQPQFCAIAA